MIIHLYALCWNEEKILPYFLQHYEHLVTHFFIFDNESTDQSREILHAHPKVTVNNIVFQTDSFVLEALHFYNNIWKQSRGQADWVILCNVDEFFYHKHWDNYLKKSMRKKITMIPSVGYQMISENFPDQGRLTELVQYGNQDNAWSKIACFNPNKIEEINFSPGRHIAEPSGKVIYPSKAKMKLLHFKYLGLRYITERYAELSQRLKCYDKEVGFGHQYLFDCKVLESEFYQNLKTAKLITSFFEQASGYFKKIRGRIKTNDSRC